MNRPRRCRICNQIGHNARTCPQREPAPIGEHPTIPHRTSKSQEFCIECTEVHQHSDGAHFCSRYAARINVNSLRPSWCNGYNLRKGTIPKAALKKGDGSKLEKEIHKW